PEFQRMLVAQRAYHFVDGKRLQELRESAFRQKNLKVLGHYLHALQDTFAHSLMDYSDLPPLDKVAASLGRLPDEQVIGHLLYGHSVDRTYERPDLAEFMAKYVYKELTEFQGSANLWNGVEAAVVRFVNAKDLDKKLRYLSASSPSSPPVVSSQPSGLPTKPQEPLYEGRSFVEWLGDLRDPSSEIRLRAAQALRHFGSRAAPLLAQTVTDADPNVRWAAASALGEIGPEAKDAVPALLQALRDPEDMVRGSVRYALRQIDPTVLREAESAQRKEEARLREQSAQREAENRTRQVQRKEICKDKSGYWEPSGRRIPTNTWEGLMLSTRDYVRPCPEEGDEARKAAADRLNVAFVRAHRVHQSVSCETLSRNPFAFEGKVVAVQMTFEQMVARDKAILGVANPFGEFGGCGIVVSGVPQGVFSTQRAKVVVAGRVLGATEAKFGQYPSMKVAHLEFSGLHTCKEHRCEDFFGPESLQR
ncbi:MAG: HEAT repeat domain-containing protein, partial [Candidatus Methylomirabilis sp.]